MSGSEKDTSGMVGNSQNVVRAGMFPDTSPTPTPTTRVPEITPLSLTSVLTSVHSLLTLYSTNPAIIIQIQTQVMYWLGCEVFNHIIEHSPFCQHLVKLGISSNVLRLGANLHPPGL